MKQAYNTGVWVLLLTAGFWLIYTVVFLFIDGWHWNPVNPIEMAMDSACSVMFGIGRFLWLYSVIALVHTVMTGTVTLEEEKEKGDLL